MVRLRTDRPTDDGPTETHQRALDVAVREQHRTPPAAPRPADIEGAVHERLLQPDQLDDDLTQLAAARRRGEAPRPSGLPFSLAAVVE